jgi:flagellar motility protein MotE (MotC chaperone)
MSFAPIFDAVKLILQAFNLLGNSAFTVGGALGVLTNLFHLLSIPVKIVANGILGLTQFFINCKNTLITLTVIMAIYRLAMWQATLATQGWTIATKLQYTWLLLCEKAQKLFNATLLKNPFTAALVGITLVVGALMTLRKRTREASDEFAKAKEAAQSYYAQERQSLDQIFEKLKRTNPKSKERNELVDELKRMYPDLNAELEKEVRNTNELSGAYDALISKIALRARIEAKKTALVDIYKGMEGFDNAVSTFADDIIKEGGSYTIDKEGERSEVDVSEANRSLIENDIKNKLLRNDASLGAGMLRINVNGNNYDLDIKTALDYLKSDEKAKRLQKQIADITFGDGDGGTSGGMTFTSTNADTFNSISAGGSKPTNIYITLTKDVVGQITIHANSVAVSTTEMVDVVKQGMLQVLNSANAIATS